MPTQDDLRILASGRFLRLVQRGAWEYADRVNCTGAVVIVALTSERELVLVEQFRIPIGRRTIELPAGLVGDTEDRDSHDFEATVRRELLEETGFTAQDVERLVEGPTSGGLSTEMVTLFLATGLRREAAGGGVAGEQIVVHVVPVADAEAWLARRMADGVAVDPKVYAGIYFAARRLGGPPGGVMDW